MFTSPLSTTRSTAPSNEAGSVAGLLLLVGLVIIFLSLIGWSVYSHQHASHPVASTAAGSTSPVTPQPAGPEATWKTATLRYEHASFRYPGTWHYVDQSSDGSDTIEITGPKAFKIAISTGGFGHPSTDGPTTVWAAIPVLFLGKTGYLDYTSYGTDTVVDVVSLSQSPTKFLDTFPSRATGQNMTPGGNFMITANYPANQGLSASQAQADPNYQALQRLVTSIAY